VSDLSAHPQLPGLSFRPFAGCCQVQGRGLSSCRTPAYNLNLPQFRPGGNQVVSGPRRQRRNPLTGVLFPHLLSPYRRTLHYSHLWWVHLVSLYTVIDVVSSPFKQLLVERRIGA